jgi:hypothetical protein
LQGILGFTDRIDENGDADGNYTLLALIHDNVTVDITSYVNNTDSALSVLLSNEHQADFGMQHRMMPVGRFTKTSHTDRLPELFLDRTINWLAKTAPRGEPECGFDGTKCVQMPSYIWLMAIFCCLALVAVVVGLLFR